MTAKTIAAMASLFSPLVAVRVACVGVLIWSPNLVVRASLALIHRPATVPGSVRVRFRIRPVSRSIIVRSNPLQRSARMLTPAMYVKPAR